MIIEEMKYTAFKIIFNLIYYLNIFIFRFDLCIWNTYFIPSYEQLVYERGLFASNFVWLTDIILYWGFVVNANK